MLGPARPTLNAHVWHELVEEWSEGFFDAPGSATEVDPYCPWAVVYLGSYDEERGTERLIVLYPDQASAEVGIFQTDMEPVALVNLATGHEQEIISR